MQRWLKQKEARAYLGNVSHQTFKKLESKGIKRYYICGVMRYDKMELDQKIKEMNKWTNET